MKGIKSVFKNKKDWKNIHPDFTEELQKEWKERRFSYEECKEWINTGLSVSDADYAYWLRDIKKVDEEWMLLNKGNEEELRKESKNYWGNQKLGVEVIKQIRNYETKIKKIESEVWKKETKRLIQENDFRDIREEFGEFGLLIGYKQLVEFAESQAKINKSINSKLTQKQNLTQKHLHYINKLNKELKDRYIKYGLCQECNQPNASYDIITFGWCQSCNSKHFQLEFENWTSGNQKIDKLIQKYQWEATHRYKILEWIPYERFTEIEHLANGGFSKVYKAKWSTGDIHYWDVENNEWKRSGIRNVVLKSLNDSQNINITFLQEITSYKLLDSQDDSDSIVSGYVLPCVGISQDPKTKNYIMVMKYIKGGDLRKFLKENEWLTFYHKLQQLNHISKGLNSIHEKGLVHRDFHPGNILINDYPSNRPDINDSILFYCFIADLGLSRPVNEINNEDKVYGVMPYVAPEVLQKKPHTPASDIYSFGIVAYEVLSGLPPYYDREHSTDLALEIIQGLRPQFQIKIPSLLKDLINRCWDSDPKQRPSSDKLWRTLDSWYDIFLGCKKTELTQQVQEAEEHNKTLPDAIGYPQYEIHPGVSYYSKPINTKQITQLLQQGDSKLLELNLDNLNLEDTQEHSSLSAQIEIPPKGNN